MKATRYKVHRFCELLPAMSPEEFADLKKSVRTTEGNDVPALAWGGQLLDGRHREQACAEEGKKFYVQEWRPKSRDLVDQEFEILDLIEQRNLTRRTCLTSSQRAHLISQLDAERAKLQQAQGVGGAPAGDENKTTQTTNDKKHEEKQVEKGGGENSPLGKKPPKEPRSTRSRAKRSGVDKHTQAAADDCVARGSEALNKAIQDGLIKASDAAKVLDHPKDVQDVAVERVREGKEKTVTKAVQSVLGATPFDEPLMLCNVVLDSFVPKMQEHALIIQRALGAGAGSFTSGKIANLAGKIFEEFKSVRKVLEHAQAKHKCNSAK